MVGWLEEKDLHISKGYELEEQEEELVEGFRRLDVTGRELVMRALAGALLTVPEEGLQQPQARLGRSDYQDE